ncbi:hypothetical protein HDU76_013165 [Blyttiomyces sp. JEL0837]|nr:hypothetical protein HDU76_013165 [Blyttiomyces sp. JEL0837]
MSDTAAPVRSAGNASKGLLKSKAVEYTKLLQRTVSPDVYDEFLNIMTMFKTKELTRRAMVAEIDALLTSAGHPQLLEDFSVFLPPGWTMDSIREANSSIDRIDHDSLSVIAPPSTIADDASSVKAGRIPMPSSASVSGFANVSTSAVVGAGKKMDGIDNANQYEGIAYQRVDWRGDMMGMDLNVCNGNDVMMMDGDGIARAAEPMANGDNADQDELGSVFSEPAENGQSWDAGNPMLERVKITLENSGEPEKYQELLEIINECKTIPSSYPSVIAMQRLRVLLAEYPDLVAQFEMILPFISMAASDPEAGSISPARRLSTIQDVPICVVPKQQQQQPVQSTKSQSPIILETQQHQQHIPQFIKPTPLVAHALPPSSAMGMASPVLETTPLLATSTFTKGSHAHLQQVMNDRTSPVVVDDGDDVGVHVEVGEGEDAVAVETTRLVVEEGNQRRGNRRWVKVVGGVAQFVVFCGFGVFLTFVWRFALSD